MNENHIFPGFLLFLSVVLRICVNQLPAFLLKYNNVCLVLLLT